MTIKNADKSAIPNQALGIDGLPTHKAEFGLTKREMMAMHIAAGLISDPQVKTHQVAEDAVRVADWLLAELERTK